MYGPFLAGRMRWFFACPGLARNARNGKTSCSMLFAAPKEVANCGKMMINDMRFVWNLEYQIFRHTPISPIYCPFLVDVDVHNRRIYDAIILIWSYLIKSEHTFFGTWLVFLSFRSLERHLDFYSVPMLRLMTWCDQDTNATLFSGHKRGHHRSSKTCVRPVKSTLQ